MKPIAPLFILLLCACSSVQKRSSGSFSQGIRALHDSKLIKARENLESLSVKDEKFLMSLTELQKINYREGKWDKFFGQSFYYRNSILKTPSPRRFSQRLIVLEVLALARHCRFKEAAQVARWGVALGNSLGKRPVADLQRSIELFAFNSSIPDRNKKKPILSKGGFHQDLAWSLSAKQMASLTNPKELRVKVKSHCL